MQDIVPSLFGQLHSSRDYTNPDCWGKNQFNSSFPASLIAYMYSKGIAPKYLCTNSHNQVVHKYITADKLYGINPLSNEAYYNFEAGYAPYERFYTGPSTSYN